MYMDRPDVSLGCRYATVTISDRRTFLQTLHTISDRYATHIVCFDADKLAGRRHAEMAIRHADRSFSNGTAISNSFEMEALLYAAGSRQCSMAVPFGLHDGENHLYVCCCPDVPGAWQVLADCLSFTREPPEEISPEKAARLAALFDVTPAEIEATGIDRLPDLVLERVALLDVSK